MSRLLRIWGAALVLTLLAPQAGLADDEEEKKEEKPQTVALGEKVPDFALFDSAKNKVNFADFAEEIVVLEWINPDCPYVKRHYQKQTMKQLAEKYAGQGVVWLAINSTHYATHEQNAEWIEKFELPYRILSDPSGEVGRMFNARTTPHMYIVNKGVLEYDGAIDNDPRGRQKEATNYVDQVLGQLIAGQEVSERQNKPYGCSVKYKKRR